MGINIYVIGIISIYVLIGVIVIGFINSRYNLGLNPSENESLTILVTIMTLAYPIVIICCIIFESWKFGTKLGKIKSK